MIEMVMMVALGFLLGCLLAILVAQPYWRRAVRLTRRRMETTMPMTVAEIRADKDQLRAQFAIQVQRLESIAAKAKDKAVRQLVEANKRRAAIGVLERELAALKRRYTEMENANAALTETVGRRLPALESEVAAAHAEVGARDSELAGFKADYAAQTKALSAARDEAKRRADEIERLRLALETAPDSSDADDPRRLAAELSRAREELHRRKQIEAQENAELLDQIQKLSDRIAENAPRSHTAEIMPLPKPARDAVTEPEPPRQTEPSAAEPPAKESAFGRVRALKRAGGGGKRSLSERLAADNADAD